MLNLWVPFGHARHPTRADGAWHGRRTVRACPVSVTGGAEIGTSPYVYPFGSADADWADSSFCSANGVPTIGASYNGVAACGDPFVKENSNYHGPISYNGVTLDFYGFRGSRVRLRAVPHRCDGRDGYVTPP